jgi:hypothetical protein
MNSIDLTSCSSLSHVSNSAMLIHSIAHSFSQFQLKLPIFFELAGVSERFGLLHGSMLKLRQNLEGGMPGPAIPYAEGTRES